MKNTENYLLRNDVTGLIREAVKTLFNIYESASNKEGYLFYRVSVLNRSPDVNMKHALMDQLRNIFQRGGWREKSSNDETSSISFLSYSKKIEIEFSKISTSEIEINFEI